LTPERVSTGKIGEETAGGQGSFGDFSRHIRCTGQSGNA
jgi:hypothetical protein